MKCWECKQKINRAIRVFYYDGKMAKARDICPKCEPKLKRDGCNYARVGRITQRQLKAKSCGIDRVFKNNP